MSWSGFKKSLKRARIQLLQRTGRIEKTTDHSFEAKQRELKKYESRVNKLNSHCKKYLDSSRGISAFLLLALLSAQLTIAECLHRLSYANSSIPTLSYQQEMQRIDTEARPEFESLYREIVLGPVAKFASFFPRVNKLLIKREHKLLDYDDAQSKVKSEIEKPSKDAQRIVVLEDKCKMKKDVYERYNDMLIKGIPAMFAMKRDYFGCSFEHIFKVQMYFYDELGYALERVEKQVESSSRIDSERQIRDAMSEIKGLSIVMPNK